MKVYIIFDPSKVTVASVSDPSDLVNEIEDLVFKSIKKRP